jgi:hypothetical protein
MPGPLQAKLNLGAADDPLEHEADSVAEQVMATPEPSSHASTHPPKINRKCTTCEDDPEATNGR